LSDTGQAMTRGAAVLINLENFLHEGTGLHSPEQARPFLSRAMELIPDSGRGKLILIGYVLYFGYAVIGYRLFRIGYLSGALAKGRRWGHALPPK